MARRPYPWFKFWPDILRNPKIRGLTPRQFQDWLFVLCAASEQKKRWHFPDTKTATKIVGIPISRFRKLIELGLFDRVDDGICVHDYKDWQEFYPSDLDRNNLGINSAKAPHRGEREEGRREKKDSIYESLRDSELTLRQFFDKRLGETDNKIEVIGQAFKHAFNSEPDFARLAKLSADFGGAQRVLIKILSLAGFDIHGDPHDYLQVCLKRADKGESREPPDLYPLDSNRLHERLLADDAAGPGELPAHIRQQLEDKRTSGRNGAPA